MFANEIKQTVSHFWANILHQQIHTAIQQPGFKRVKRGFRTLKSPAAVSNHPIENDKETESSGKIPTDPYFPLQWYLRNTGQNGGKVRLDLNVSVTDECSSGNIK